ncbi:MAG: CBS domain-containing protein [Anaerolineales bacterium]|nr:CBS domain-containing protein [Anaerolineales bacterium]
MPTCTPDTAIPEIARLLLENNLEEVVVLADGNAVGVIGQADLAQAFTHENALELLAEVVMRENTPRVPADIPLLAAVQMMLDQGDRVVYITHHAGGIEFPAGYLSLRHILRYLAARNESELQDLGVSAQRESPLNAFIKRRDIARQKNLSQDSLTK